MKNNNLHHKYCAMRRKSSAFEVNVAWRTELRAHSQTTLASFWLFGVFGPPTTLHWHFLPYIFRQKVDIFGLPTSISSVVEFQRWWVPKSKQIGQESTCHQEKIFKKILRVMTVCQKVPKSYFQSQFWMSKINWIFSKKKLSKNINLGDHYLLKSLFF